MMPPPVLNPSALAAYLNGFQALPHTGEMIVPIIQGGRANHSEFLVTPEPLSESNAGRFAREFRSLFLGIKERKFGPWEIGPDSDSEFFFFDRLPDRFLILVSLLNLVDVTAGHSRQSRTAGMTVSFRKQGSFFWKRWLTSSSYNIRLEGLAVQGLKECLGLNQECPMHRVVDAFFESFGITHNAWEQARHDQFIRKVKEGFLRSFPEMQGIGESQIEAIHSDKLQGELDDWGFYKFWSGVRVDEHGITEYIGLTMEEEKIGGQSLPVSLKPLWDWVLSDESEPNEKDLDRYYEMTKRIYAHYLR